MEHTQPHRKLMRRQDVAGHVRYVTFSCCKRLPLFDGDEVKRIFVDRLGWLIEHMPVGLLAWAVMPEHVHLMLLPNMHHTSMSKLMIALKRPVSRTVLDHWRSLGEDGLDRVKDRGDRPHFWQPGGGYDRNIVTEHELREKVTYIHENPVRRGLANRSVDWRWSSARFYLDHATYHGPRITPIG